jgi:hypothetical protein
MTAGTHTIDHPARRQVRRTGVQRIAAMVASATRHSHSAAQASSHAGQLGPVRESEVGRRTGARV